MGGLVTADCLFVTESRTDEVETFIQGELRGGGDGKGNGRPFGANGLIGQINRNESSRAKCRNHGVIRFRELHEEQAAVRGVLSKNVAKRRAIIRPAANHGDKSGLLKRPNGMLARGATPKIRADDQNSRPRRFWEVKRKLRPSNVSKKQLAIPKPRNSAEESRGNDAIGVDVVIGIDHDFAEMSCERRHGFSVAQVILDGRLWA
jgi:hypothetical protein